MRDFFTATTKPGRPMRLLAILAGCIAASAFGCSSFRSPAGSAAVLRADGIRLQEGQNISGVYPWHDNIAMSIAYTYSFRRPGGQLPAVLEMQFELINGEVFSALTVDLIIGDENGRIVGGGRLFERKGRAYVTGPRTMLKLDPNSAYVFAFGGSGFYNREGAEEPRSGPAVRRAARWRCAVTEPQQR